MESPCILVCSIDMVTGYCFGCGRTRDEIGQLARTFNVLIDVLRQRERERDRDRSSS